MTHPQKDEFVTQIQKTATKAMIATIASSLVISVGSFFYTKFQTEANTEAIKELRYQKADVKEVQAIDARNSSEHQSIKDGIVTLQKGQDRMFNYLLNNKK
jgi:hypothetical protein